LLSSIIYEDDGLIILNKPSGMAAHGGSGINFGVIETLRAAMPQLKHLELIHRLDRGTSGCLMIAKKRSILRQIHALLREGKVIKRYLVLVRGKWQEGTAKTVDLPLAKNQLLSGERMVKVHEEGKSTLTIFRPLQISDKTSLLEAELHTGRTHQIRVHAAAIGYPVAGDDKYGDAEFNSAMKKFGLNRLFLHAQSVSFTLESGKRIDVTAPLDQGLADVLGCCRYK
jgi:23S rRNA pseudouridine955/2504/2580 synthase